MSNAEIARQMLDDIYASVPTDTFRFQCLELLHPAFNYPGMPPGRIRVVNYRIDPLTVTLENGDEATFLAAPFSVKFPAKSVSGRRDIQLTMDAIGTDTTKQLELVSEHSSRERIQAVIREYAENNLDYPGRIDDRLTVINPSVSSGRIQASLVFNDTINKTIPSINYTLESHPGLAS